MAGRTTKKKPDGAVAVENFFGVYLLYCTNPKFKGRTYIGYTVDPNRRILQHNIGKKAGGAWRTSNRGPWEMVLIIHGFLNDISALRFEWAWQHPDRSRHLRSCFSAKKSTETSYLFHIRILADMLSVGPWNRLPLTIRWLVPSYEKPFPAHKPPPYHMSICYGPIYAVKVNAPTSIGEENGCSQIKTKMCWLCMEDAELSELLTCVQPLCSLVAHTICLAKRFLENEKNQVIPVEGSCPRCKSTILWGDLIRKKKGCYVALESTDCDSMNTSCDS